MARTPSSKQGQCSFTRLIVAFSLIALLANCGHTIEDVREDWLSEVTLEKTTRKEVLLGFGIPGPTYEDEKIVIYHYREYDVIFFFNEDGILVDHAVTQRLQ